MERPILMSAPMVLAILEGRKTQTRRVAPIRDLNILRKPGDKVTWSVSFLKAVKGVLASHSGGKFSDLQARNIIASQFNPYGQPGDRLWAREAWRTCASLNHLAPRLLRPGAPIQYEAGGSNVYGPPKLTDMGKLRPGMFLPRWASRINLEITAVRVERLQDISEEDAKAEGVEAVIDKKIHGWTPYVCEFALLWKSINGPGSWELNPWVWVVSFKRVSQ